MFASAFFFNSLENLDFGQGWFYSSFGVVQGDSHQLVIVSPRVILQFDRYCKYNFVKIRIPFPVFSACILKGLINSFAFCVESDALKITKGVGSG